MERVIGAGGFGKVHCCIKKSLDDLNVMYAIKELDKMTIIEKSGHAEVFEEMRLLARLHHPLVCNIRYAFQDDRKLYLVGNIALGGDLKYRLGQNMKNTPVKISEAELRFDMFCIFEALHYLHSLQIIHRDIKPANMLIREDGYCLLTDFGISRIIPDGSKCIERSGTHGFMAPEIYLERHEHDRSYDMFSMGIAMYQLLTGSPPHSADTLENTEKWDSQEELDRLSDMPAKRMEAREYQGHVSTELVDLLRQLLFMQPEKRISWKLVRDHSFFDPINKDEVRSGKFVPPFKPNIAVANCDSTDMDVKEMFEDESAKPKPTAEQQKQFEGYAFDFTKRSSDLPLLEPKE